MRNKPTLTKGGKWKKGYFDVSNSTKYVASKSGDCIYRSSYEWRFMKWCENNPNVKSWTSEPFSVPYTDLTNPNKTRNYWIDFVVEFNDGEVLWVEVKPKSQLDDVNMFSRQYAECVDITQKVNFARHNKVEAMNYSKWYHAERYAKSRNAKFMVITENFLKK